MKLLCLFQVVIFLFSLAADAQERADTLLKIQGTITDEQNKPIPAASISLMQQIDSSLQETKISNNDGFFSFTTRPGNYFLKISSQSFQEKLVTDINAC